VTPIDLESDVPVYEQIKQQVTFGIARGTYSAGEKLPSVRAFARKLLVNPNTIVRVYRELEHDGLVRTWKGKGVFVSDDAPARCDGAGVEAVEKALVDAIELARQAGLGARELDALYRRLRRERWRDAGKKNNAPGGDA
jgi:GntR family transcriptional regulator